MLELSVAAARHDKLPTIIIEQTQNLADFRREIMRPPVEPGKIAPYRSS
jgi:hypothetical protein